MNRSKKGFILPVALIATLAATTLGGALVSGSFRAARGARLAWAGERAFHAANAAVVTEAAAWTPLRISRFPVGARDSSTQVASDVTVSVVVIRTSPATLLIDAEAEVAQAAETLARRQVTRLLYLDVSSIPVRAALTTFGGASLENDAIVSGQGSSTSGETTCGIDSDTSSYFAFASDSALSDSAHLDGPRKMRLLDADSTDALRSALWTHLQSLALTSESVVSPFTILPVEAGGICTSQSGEPRRGAFAVAACTSHWPIRALENSSGTITLANSRHQGTLVIDGNLVVQGALDLRGLLLVKGTIDARNGALRVIGAVIASHESSGTTHLGTGSSITWSRCALQRAVTPLANMYSASALQWAERH